MYVDFVLLMIEGDSEGLSRVDFVLIIIERAVEKAKFFQGHSTEYVNATTVIE
jgi:hypothetical protein